MRGVLIDHRFVPVAQRIGRRATEPGIAGSSPAKIILLLFRGYVSRGLRRSSDGHEGVARCSVSRGAT